MMLAQHNFSTKRYRHPLKSYAEHRTKSVREWRKRTLLALILGIAAVIGYYALFSPYFTLTNVTVSQPTTLDADDVRKVIDEYFNELNTVFANPRNYFLLNEQALKETLLSAFRLHNVTISKEFPNQLSLSFEDKPSLLTVADAYSDVWHVVNYRGEVLSSIKPFAHLRNTTLVWVPTGETATEGALSVVLHLTNEWKMREYFLPAGYTLLSKDLLVVETDKGFRIEFNPEADTGSQLERLSLLAQELSKKNITPSEYILLRFGEKVFYK